MEEGSLLDFEEDSQSEEEIELEGDLRNLHLNGPAPAMQSLPQGRLRLKVPNMAAMKICPLQRGLRATWAAEDTSGFKLFSIFEQLDEQNQNQNVQIYAAIPFKILKIKICLLHICPEFAFCSKLNRISV